MNNELLHVDLCCGLGGWQAPFRDSPQWRSVGIDVRRDLSPDVVADVRELPLSACEPTLVTASPPCTEFTKAWFGWHGFKNPSHELMHAVQDSIFHLGPTFFVIENSVGAQVCLGSPDKIAYPWYLWGEFPPFDPGRLPDKGTQHSGYDASVVAKIPYPLADALRRAVEWSL